MRARSCRSPGSPTRSCRPPWSSKARGWCSAWREDVRHRRAGAGVRHCRQRGLRAGAGLAGVAIGLGAQGFLTDVVNGFFILLENQFEVGDSVVIGTVEGNISSVGIRTTQIRGFDGTLHFIPNRNITVVSNKSRGDMRVQIDIPIYAHTDLEKISNIIKTINKEQLPSYPEIVGSPTILGPCTNSTAQLVFRVDIFVQNGKQSYIYSNFYRLYQEALLENDIALPTMYANPTLTK